MTKKKKDQAVDQEAIPAFKNILTVCKELKAGFKVSKDTLYRARDKGQIKVNKDGSVFEAEVRAYAATLEHVEGDIGDLNDIHAVKASKEVERLNEQIAKLKFANEKEAGKYIKRSDFEAELAARGVVLESGFRHLFNMKVREWITLVGGKVEKAPDFLQDLNIALDQQMNAYATIKTFQVMFEEE